MSIASDTYGRNPSQRSVQRTMRSAGPAPTSLRSGVVASRVTPPRATTIKAMPVRDGYCSRIGQSFRFASCDCACHFAEPGTSEPCDRAYDRGLNRCSYEVR